jgi:hypothetical protein
MPNDSSTGGPLVPSNSIDYDATLEDVIQAVVSDLTGIARTLVRPRFQPEAPNMPDFSTDWIALGVSVQDHDQFSYQHHDPNADVNGANWVERDELLELFLSFYGPNSSGTMSQWRDGLSVASNLWPLLDAGIKLVDIGKPIYLPALLKEKWTKRVDIKTLLNRRVKRIYPVRDASQVTVITQTEQRTFTTIVSNS